MKECLKDGNPKEIDKPVEQVGINKPVDQAKDPVVKDFDTLLHELRLPNSVSGEWELG